MEILRQEIFRIVRDEQNWFAFDRFCLKQNQLYLIMNSYGFCEGREYAVFWEYTYVIDLEQQRIPFSFEIHDGYSSEPFDFRLMLPNEAEGSLDPERIDVFFRDGVRPLIAEERIQIVPLGLKYVRHFGPGEWNLEIEAWRLKYPVDSALPFDEQEKTEAWQAFQELVSPKRTPAYPTMIDFAFFDQQGLFLYGGDELLMRMDLDARQATCYALPEPSVVVPASNLPTANTAVLFSQETHLALLTQKALMCFQVDDFALQYELRYAEQLAGIVRPCLIAQLDQNELALGLESDHEDQPRVLIYHWENQVLNCIARIATEGHVYAAWYGADKLLHTLETETVFPGGPWPGSVYIRSYTPKEGVCLSEEAFLDQVVLTRHVQRLADGRLLFWVEDLPSPNKLSKDAVLYLLDSVTHTCEEKLRLPGFDLMRAAMNESYCVVETLEEIRAYRLEG